MFVRRAGQSRWGREKRLSITILDSFKHRVSSKQVSPSSTRLRVAQVIASILLLYLVVSTVWNGSGYNGKGLDTSFSAENPPSSTPLATSKPPHVAVWEHWKNLRGSTPQPNPNSEAWIIQKAQLYKHLWRMRQFRRYIVGEIDNTLLDEMDQDLISIERDAFDFMTYPSRGNSSTEQVPEMTSMLSLVAAFSQKEKHFNSTRGIVVVAGERQFRFVLHLVATLRYVIKSAIPIEVFYKGEEDLSLYARQTLELFPDVVTKNLFTVNNVWNDEFVEFANATYALKPFALLASEFEEPLLCDADVIFLQDPYKLYDDFAYADTGTLFYHDRHWKGWGLRKWLRTQFEWHGIEPSPWLETRDWWTQEFDGHEQDSGVVLLNKSREDVLFSAMFAAWLNGRRQRDSTDTFILGDKETFWLAFELTRQPYAFAPGYAGTAGKLLPKYDVVIVDNMLHFDRDLQPLWINGGLLFSKHKSHSGWLEVDVYAHDDGVWTMTNPLFTYSGAKWVPAQELGQKIRRMCALAHEADNRYKPLIL